MTAHMREEEQVDPKLLSHIPLGRLGSADDIAGACVFLGSRAGRYVTGDCHACRWRDRGMRLIPPAAG